MNLKAYFGNITENSLRGEVHLKITADYPAVWQTASSWQASRPETMICEFNSLKLILWNWSNMTSQLASVIFKSSMQPIHKDICSDIGHCFKKMDVLCFLKDKKPFTLRRWIVEFQLSVSRWKRIWGVSLGTTKTLSHNNH